MNKIFKKYGTERGDASWQFPKWLTLQAKNPQTLQFKAIHFCQSAKDSCTRLKFFVCLLLLHA